MQTLNLPPYKFKITRDEAKKPYIYDEYRKKNLRLTPEEWVRQHILRYLTEEKEFPKSLISSEAGIKVNRLSRRYDALVYNRTGAPLLLIECKAPTVPISQATFDQVVAYNQSIKAPLILVTNGIRHFCCQFDKEKNQFIYLPEIPSFKNIGS